MPRRRSIWALFATATLSCALLVGSTTSQAAVQPAKPSDFNGDGYPDLAIGAPLARPKPFTLRQRSGGVGLVYGGKSVLGTKTQLLHRGLSWVPGTQATYQYFGRAVAAADFNGDGYSDIAICSDLSFNEDRLTFGFGGSTGLWRGYDVPFAHREGGCRSLATGDFNGDGYADLVLAGKGLLVFYGEAWLTQPPKAEDVVPFGPDLWAAEPAVGDVNGDGIDDLVTGSSGGGVGYDTSIRLYRGSGSGLPTEADQVVPSGGFYTTALGDVDGDGFADLAAGNSSQTRSGKAGAGLVRLWWGSAAGIDTSRKTVDLAQDLAGVPGDVAVGDAFGYDVALGDVDGDKLTDVAVGAFENVGNRTDAGTVTVVRGSKTGWDLSKPTPYLSQDSPGVPEEVEADDQFGASVLLRDFDADGRAELVVAAPFDDVGSKPIVRKDAGTVTIFRGTTTGVTTAGAKLVTPTTVRMMSVEAQLGELDD